jgi:hypothetical protein
VGREVAGPVPVEAGMVAAGVVAILFVVPEDEGPVVVAELVPGETAEDPGFVTELTTCETVLLMEVIALETELEALDTARDTDELTLETALFTELDTLETALFTELETLETALFIELDTLETALFTELDALETALLTELVTLETTLFTELVTLETVLLMDLNDQAPEMFFISSSPRTLAPGTPLSVRIFPVNELEKASMLVVRLMPKAGSKKLIVFSPTLLTVT